MRVLVTGVAGFIGQALAQRLLARGDVVVGVDNLNDYYQVSLKEARLAGLRDAGGNRFAFHHLDFAYMAGLKAALYGVEIDRIVHLGAQAGVRYSIENPHAYVQANVVGHLNMLELARARGVEHMVYASSSSVYGGNTKLPFAVEDRVDHPLSLYAATKKADELMSETYAHVSRLPLTGLRFFTIYGPWGRPDMAYFLFTKAILTGASIKLFNHGKMRRDFTYIDDVTSAIMKLINQPPRDAGQTAGPPARVYNVGNNHPEELTHVVAVLEQELGRAAVREMLPMQPGDVTETFADVTELMRDTGFRPQTSIEDGLRAFVAWYRDHYRI